MKKKRGIIRVIDGVRYRCLDVGCDDWERAKYNRLIVKNKLFDIYYKELEAWLAHAPLNQPLPNWIKQGELPQIGKREYWPSVKPFSLGEEGYGPNLARE